MVMVSMVAVVAMAENRVIGDGKGLIWHIPNDLKRVKSLPWLVHLLWVERRGTPLVGHCQVELAS